MTKRSEWLERDLLTGPCLRLCLTEEAYHDALKDAGVAHRDAWISNEQSNATAHHVKSASGRLCAIVCVRVSQQVTPVQIVGLLVHEAVHVFQRFCWHIGEDNPGAETEAYSIQTIAQRLCESYIEQTFGGKA